MVPLPLNGSRMMSPGRVVRSMQFSTSWGGNGAGWFVWLGAVISQISVMYWGFRFSR